MRIALDAMGGDEGAPPNIQGAAAAINADPELEVVLVGDEAALQCALDQTQPSTCERLSVVHADGVVGMHEKPTEALRSKPNCSIAVCWKLMADQQVDAVVSAGNTGAVVAAGLRTRLYLKGVRRPGIAVPLPTMRGRSVLMDVGANPSARPEHLLQYGIMASVYAREMLGVENPSVGLMNIGSEEGKGNDLYRETHSLLCSSLLNDRYVGNVEGRGLYQGQADVLICEGFVGNVVLKVSEGMAEFMMNAVAGGVLQKLDAERDVAARALQELAKKYQYQEGGGAPLLGIDGICIIAHGSSDARSIANALGVAARFKNRRLNALIASDIAAAKTNGAATA